MADKRADIIELGRRRRLARLARLLDRPELDRRKDHETRARVDEVPPDTPEDVRERRRKLARRDFGSATAAQDSTPGPLLGMPGESCVGCGKDYEGRPIDEPCDCD